MQHRTLLAVAFALTSVVATTTVPAFGAPTPLEPTRVVDLTHLEVDSLSAVLSSGDNLRLFDPRNSQMVAASLDGTLQNRVPLQVGVPAHVIEVDGQFVRLGYERVVDIDGQFVRLDDERATAKKLTDADAFWAPTTLSWRRDLDFSRIGDAVDLTRSAAVKSRDTLAYHVASVLNFTVTSGDEHLMAVGTLIADGATQDQLSVYSYRVTPDERPSPVTLHFPIFDRSAMVFYRVYNYLAEANGWAYLAVLDGTPTLYRWRPGQIAPTEVTVRGDSPFGTELPYVDPMLPPHDLLAEIEAKERLLTGLVASPTGNVFAIVRHPDGPQAARWNLVRLEPAADGSAAMDVGATFELPTRAPEIVLSASDDGRWLLFEKAPLTNDLRQPIKTLIELDANIVESGRRNVKSPRGTTRR